MRIVSGKFKSRIIKAPKGQNTRPSSDRTRESIFNVLAPYLYDANVLDLFAGSGALGIEALSRGASHVVFIDHDDCAIQCIRENVSTLKINQQCEIIQGDYSILPSLKGKTFQIILLDPPYAMNVFLDILHWIEENHLLDDHGVIVYESNQQNHLQEDILGYRLKVKKYGVAYVNILFKNQ